MALLPAAQADPTLSADLLRLLGQPPFAHAAWGIKVISLPNGQPLFETNSHLLLKPASNAKLFTGAMVLDQFSSQHRIVTSVYATGLPDPQGRVRGDLLIYGRGDPSFAARFHEGDPEKSLQRLLQAIDKSGIRFIEGRLLGDESYFFGPPFGSSWTWSDLGYYYGAEVSALTSDDNVIDLTLLPGLALGEPGRIQASPPAYGLTLLNRTRTVPPTWPAWEEVTRLPGQDVVQVTGELPLGEGQRLDAITVPRPGMWFMRRLSLALEAQGLAIQGNVGLIEGNPEEPGVEGGLRELARTQSPPMGELVRHMMKPSQNLHAHLLWLQAGATLPVPPSSPRPLSTAQAGRQAMTAFLIRMDMDPDQVQLNEGSGLSRDALVTPAAIVDLLIKMRTHPEAAAFHEALPIAGMDGTLRRRLTSEDTRGMVHAKTGTLRHVLCLSGYVEPPEGRTLVFSIMLNQFAGDPAEGREAIDAMVTRLVAHARAAGEPLGERH